MCSRAHAGRCAADRSLGRETPKAARAFLKTLDMPCRFAALVSARFPTRQRLPSWMTCLRPRAPAPPSGCCRMPDAASPIRAPRWSPPPMPGDSCRPARRPIGRMLALMRPGSTARTSRFTAICRSSRRHEPPRCAGSNGFQLHRRTQCSSDAVSQRRAIGGDRRRTAARYGDRCGRHLTLPTNRCCAAGRGLACPRFAAYAKRPALFALQA